MKLSSKFLCIGHSGGYCFSNANFFCKCGAKGEWCIFVLVFGILFGRYCAFPGLSGRLDTVRKGCAVAQWDKGSKGKDVATGQGPEKLSARVGPKKEGLVA